MLAVHLAVTIFLVVALLGDRLTPLRALFLIPFGLLPDMDIYVFVHRATAHNLFIPLLLLCGYWAMSWRWDRLWEYAYLAYLAVGLVTVHIFLDAMYNGVFLLYPFDDTAIRYEGWVGVTTEGVSARVDKVVVGDVPNIIYTTEPAKLPEKRIAVIEDGVQLAMLVLSFATLFIRLAVLHVRSAKTSISWRGWISRD